MSVQIGCGMVASYFIDSPAFNACSEVIHNFVRVQLQNTIAAPAIYQRWLDDCFCILVGMHFRFFHKSSKSIVASS